MLSQRSHNLVLCPTEPECVKVNSSLEKLHLQDGEVVLGSARLRGRKVVEKCIVMGLGLYIFLWPKGQS